jgi:hypothetical protein
MLPSELEEILKKECWYANPMGCDVYNTRFKDVMHNFDKYKAFLDACGHDTQELAGAIAGSKAAIQELKRVNESMTETFKKDPFPFTKVASDEARCRHDTQELAGVLAFLTKTATRELKRVNESMTETFKKDPFPFTKAASDVVNEQAEAEYEQAKAEYKQVRAKCLAEMDKREPGIYYGYELEGAAPS